jgi:tetratricopeptide (TPR) repeat protein
MNTKQPLSILLIATLGLAGDAWAQADKAPKAVVAPKAAKAKPKAVSAEQAKKAQGLFEAGQKMFFQGKYAEAIEVLLQAVKTDPSKGSFKLLLAKAYRYANKREKAEKLLGEILKENPEHVEAGVALAELLDPIKKPDQVIKTLEPLLKFKHDYPLYHLLAEAHYEKENLNKARGYYEEAVKLNPRSGGDYYQLGNIYLSQRRFAKAARAYERGGELGIDSDVYHFKLASVYFSLRNYLGRVVTAKVIGGQPGEIKGNLFLIDPVPGKKDIFYVAGQKSSVFQVVKAQKMGIKIPQIKFLEANIWLSARRYAKANPIYKSLEGKLQKQDQGLFWFYWSKVALGMDQYDMYLARLDKAIEAEPTVYKPTLADAYVTVASRYQQKGDSKKYIEHLVKAMQTNPLSAGLHLRLGDAYWQASQRENAVKQYKLVLELSPDHSHRVRLLNRIRGEEDLLAPSNADARTAGR